MTPFISLIYVNLTRLTMTFGIGVLTLVLFARIGADAQVFYLGLISLRWMLAIPANALEITTIAGAAKARRGNIDRLTLAVSGATALISLVITVIFRPEYVWLCITFTGTWTVAQTLAAPRLSQLLVDGKNGLHAMLLFGRRATDLIAILVAIHFSPDDPIPLFLGVGALLVIIHTGAILSGAKLRLGEPIAHGRYFSALSISASQAMSLRFPVFILASFQSVTLLPAMIGFVLAGYLRQGATAALMGLDGFVARHSKDCMRRKLIRLTLGFSILLSAIVASVQFLLPEILPHLLPEGITLSIAQHGIIKIILYGVAARCLCDLIIKLATGIGQITEIARITGGVAIFVALAMITASIAFPVTSLGSFLAWLFCLGQGAALVILGVQFAKLTLRPAPLLPAE